VVPTLGEQLGFHADSIDALGLVVRHEGDECAIEFAPPIGVMQVQHLRRVGQLDGAPQV